MQAQLKRGSAGVPGKIRGSSGSSLAESVYARILEAINSGEIRPGDALREIELASNLGVSRTPIREALHKLESEEILVKRDRSLIFPIINDKQVLELYAMREVLEGTAAGLAAQAASSAEIDMIGQIYDTHSSIPDSASAQHAAMNVEFHSAIYRAANNRYLLKSLSAMHEAIARLQSTTFSCPGRPARALREHAQILKAIGKRNAVIAEAAARAHIREALRHRMLLIQKARIKS